MPNVLRSRSSGSTPFRPNDDNPNEWAIGHIDQTAPYHPSWRGVNWSHLKQLLDLMPRYLYYDRATVLYAVSVVGMLYPTSERISYDTVVRPREDWHRFTNAPHIQWPGLSFEEQVEEAFLMHQGTPQHIVGWIMRPAREYSEEA